MKLFFDIGSNRGDVAQHYLARGYKVVCVEPNAVLCEDLRKRFARKPVFVEECAVGPVNGELEFFIAQVDTISTASTKWMTESRFAESYKWQPGRKVPSVTIDHLIGKHGLPDIIKIDVEGFEHEAIKGFTHPGVDLIMFE